MSILKRLDGWFNIATNLGSRSQDKTRLSSFSDPTFVCDDELSNLFHYDPIARKICRKPGDEALRQGVKVHIDSDAESSSNLALSTKISDSMRRLDAVRIVADAIALEEAFGGAAIWLGLDDSRSRELSPGPYSNVNFLRPIDRRFLEPVDYDEDPRSPLFGRPLTYRFSSIGGRTQNVIKIHRDRLIILPGRQVTEDERARRNSWGMSALQLVYEALQRNAQAWQTAGYAFQDRGYGILKLSNLHEMLEREGGREAVEARTQAVQLGKSVARTVIIGDEEEWDSGNLDFGGMPKMLEEFMHDIASAVDVPVTVLFGRSPGGENATGESDLRLWYDHVAEIQEQRLRRVFERVALALMNASSGPTDGVNLDSWRVEFPPLRRVSPLERADIRLKTSQADSLDVNASILLPEEVALSRFRPEGFSVETVVDVENRRTIAENTMQTRLERSEMSPEELIAEAEATRNTSGVSPDPQVENDREETGR